MRVRPILPLTGLALLLGCLSGCAHNEPELHYLGESDLEYYREVATRIDAPLVESETAGEALHTQRPRTVDDLRKDQLWDMTLTEALHTALQNNPIIRSNAQFLQPSNQLFNNPNNIPSVFDPAIQDSGVLFGSRGVESALSAFDPTVNATMVWGRDEELQNNFFFGGGLNPGTELVSETANFDARLQKQFGYGGQFALVHSWLYRGTNSPGVLFPSAYDGLLQAQYRHPLLAGAGTEFTRIAGPITQSFGGITGVTQGVVIARINADISIADFEASVRNLAREVEELYWNLYLQYRLYDISIVARNSALQTWREVQIRREEGAAGREEELQARAQYFEARAAVRSALSSIYSTEQRLRRLLGLCVNDGRVIRPSDEPPMAKFVPDWHVSMAEALTNRVELRRQKFSIKSLELQLKAAHSLTKPRLDFVGSYQVNALGDQLFGEQDNDGQTARGLRSGYEVLAQGDQTGWGVGFEFNMPLGLRSAHAQVRNIELRLAKAREVLATQELDVSHEMAVAFQDLAVNYATAEENFNRRTAAAERVEVFRIQEELEKGGVTTDLVLRAQRDLAAADQAYFTSLSNYAQSVMRYHFTKGNLLEVNNVHLAEGAWTPQAYQQSLRRAWARSYALEHNMTDAEPDVFVTPEPPASTEYVPSIEHVPSGTAEGHPTELEPEPIPYLNPAPKATAPPPAPAPADEPAQEFEPAQEVEVDEVPALLPEPALEPVPTLPTLGSNTRSRTAPSARPVASWMDKSTPRRTTPGEESLELLPGRDYLE